MPRFLRRRDDGFGGATAAAVISPNSNPVPFRPAVGDSPSGATAAVLLFLPLCPP